MLGRFVLALTAIGVALALAAWGWTWVGRGGDPLLWLPRAAAEPQVTAQQWFPRGDRILHAVTLDDPRLGRFRFVVSLPNPMPDEKLPIVFVLGGLGTAEENLAPVTAPGANVLIGYDWPIPTFLPEPLAMLGEVERWRSIIEVIPGQLSAVLRWAAAQPWGDRERISLLGVSLGSLAVPATARMAAEVGVAPRSIVLAYGGAPIARLVANHPELEGQSFAPLLGFAAGEVLRGIEPTAHLGSMPGETLVIGSRTDRLIPTDAAETMATLAPDPKQIIWMQGDHIGIGPQQQETLAAVMRQATAWLLERRAINR